MTKILHIPNYYRPHVGGIESTAENIIYALKKTNEYQQKVICFGDGPNLINDVEIIRLPYLVKIASQAISFKFYFTLKRTINNFKPDIILLHTPNPLVEFYLHRCKYKGKLIVYHHLDIYRQKILKYFVKPITNKTNNDANIIIASSEKYIDGSRELLQHKDKCTVIPLCYKEDDLKLNDEEILQVNKIREKYKGKTILFYSGRHASFKGLKYALKAIDKLDNVVFLVGRVGPYHLSIDKKIIRSKNGLSLGLLDRSQYKVYLHSCDIFIFPSVTKNESFGITLLEATSLGKPAVTFNIPGSGVNFVSLNNVTGIECDNKNIIEFSKAISELINNNALREEYKVNAVKRAKQLFSHEQFEQAFINLFKEISKKS